MAVARDFLLPDLGEGLTEAELVRWLVAVGDSVAVDQPIVEVETAKAVVEVPSPFAGVVTVLHGQPGETLDVGRPLISIDEGSAGHGGTAAEAHRTEERAGSDAPSGSGNVLIGYGTSGSSSGGRTRSRKGSPATQSAAAPTGSQAQSLPAQAIRVVSPLVRRLARDLGVNLHAVSGSGPDGLILRRDVEVSAP
uniref:biotin/lipoyl-containing protein n=1 Tax=Sinomonas sp. G460-2 TaxID=3393464 RepID=UPI0039EE66BC